MARSMQHTRFLSSVLLVLAVLAAACVMPADIRALESNMIDFEAGAVTKPEFDARSAEIFERIDERSDDLPSDPVSLLLYGATVLGTILGGNHLTNAQRDKRRKGRNEPV